MTRGTFPERHSSGSRQQPHGPREDMSNQYGRIGHGLLGDNIRGPEPERSAERDAQEELLSGRKPETIRKGAWGDQSRSSRSRPGAESLPICPSLGTDRTGVRSGRISGFDVPEISVVDGVDFNRAESAHRGPVQS